MKVDLRNNLKFPSEIAVTNQRPDMLIISNSTKKVGLVELTVPSEERVEISGEMKKEKNSMMRGKSPPSELILEVIKANNSL